jgi:hypothetical protein
MALLHHTPTAPPRTAAALAATFASIQQHHAVVSSTLCEVATSTPGIGLRGGPTRTTSAPTWSTWAHTTASSASATTAASATGSRSRKRGAPCGDAEDADEAVTVPMKAMKGAVLHVRESVFRGPSCDGPGERRSRLASAATDATSNGFVIQGVNAAAAAAAAAATAAVAAAVTSMTVVRPTDLGNELKAVGLSELSSAAAAVAVAVADTLISVLPPTPNADDAALFDCSYADANTPDETDETQGLQGIISSLLSILSASGQGLTLVHFSAQLELFLTQNAP